MTHLFFVTLSAEWRHDLRALFEPSFAENKQKLKRRNFSKKCWICTCARLVVYVQHTTLREVLYELLSFFLDNPIVSVFHFGYCTLRMIETPPRYGTRSAVFCLNRGLSISGTGKRGDKAITPRNEFDSIFFWCASAWSPRSIWATASFLTKKSVFVPRSGTGAVSHYNCIGCRNFTGCTELIYL